MVFLTTGQIVIGASKGYYCTWDGEGGEGGTSSGFNVIAKDGGAARLKGSAIKVNVWTYYYCGSGDSGGGCNLSSITVPNSGNGGARGDAAAGIVVIRNHRE